MPLMDNHLIFLDYSIYLAVTWNQNEYHKHNAPIILASYILRYVIKLIMVGDYGRLETKLSDV